ncbi:MAG: PAS-domain containing protein [Rhodospirillales bacterium]|nr:PAS-domain containing protein [Rhodospirillales bacterium]MBO6785439.1 PAS-domain containing protein [Rhodospirillales bacterium]
MAASDTKNNLARDEIDALRMELASLRARLERAEAATVISEAMENSSEAIVIYDEDGLLVACNRNFRELYGYTEEEASKGVHFAELGRIDVERGNVVIGDEFGDGDDYLNRKAEYRKTLKGSFVVQLKDGRWIKTVDRRMQRGGFVSVQVDITDVKKNEQDLRDAKEAAEKAAQFKSEFLANISHDLRTPLNAIIGFSELIQSEFRGPLGHEDYREYVADIKDSGHLLLSIVNDLLDTAKLESGRLHLVCEDFDAIGCSEEVVKRIRPITSKKHLNLSISKDANFPEVIPADRRATIQVLNNLIANAAKHSEDGADIGIHWHVPEPDSVAVTVSDTGTGIAPELIEKIGDPFLQEGSYAVHPGERGAGLGLYICTKLIAAMGGRMDVESELGEGTRVTMVLPTNCSGPGYAGSDAAG